MDQTFANVANYRATEDWWFLLPAILIVDVVVIFLVRFFPLIFGETVNIWYDNFGLAAVLSDVGIIAIGIAITRYLYSYFFLEQEGWNILYFTGVALVVQILHDIAFAFLVVKPISTGHNEMIDVFKAYIVGGPKIIAADAAMVAASIGLGAFLKNQNFHVTTSVGLTGVYALTYILFTNWRSGIAKTK